MNFKIKHIIATAILTFILGGAIMFMTGYNLGKDYGFKIGEQMLKEYHESMLRIENLK